LLSIFYNYIFLDFYELAVDRQEYCFTKDFLRTGGGPPGVLFYKRLLLLLLLLFFLKFIFEHKPLFFPDPHQKFIGAAPHPQF